MTTTPRTTHPAPPSDATTSLPAGTPADATIRLSRAAGWAALVKALTYIAGLSVMAAYLGPRGLADADGDPAASLDVLLDNADLMYVWYLALYVVGGLALIVLVQGLGAVHRRRSPGLASVATVVGHIWAGLLLASGMIALVGQGAVIALEGTDRELAVATWSSVSVVQDALGGGIEIVGAVWILLVGLMGLTTRTFGVSFNLNAVLIGLLGAATLVPAIADLAAMSFGLTFVVWFVWAAVVLLRGDRAR